MSDENRILESLGKLSGLVEASRDDIKTLVGKHDEQVRNIQNLATCIQVIQTSHDTRVVSCAKDFKEINDKLGSDYEIINELKTKAIINDGVEKYKGKKREWWQYTLGVIGAIIGILIGVNQIIGIFQKIEVSELNSIASSYSSTVNPTKSILDTTKDTTQTFSIKLDTFKGR